jgi:hypothetical protein
MQNQTMPVATHTYTLTLYIALFLLPTPINVFTTRAALDTGGCEVTDDTTAPDLKALLQQHCTAQ